MAVIMANVLWFINLNAAQGPAVLQDAIANPRDAIRQENGDELFADMVRCIEWGDLYDRDTELAVLTELNRLPKSVLTSWLYKADGCIHIVPPIKGYIDRETLYDDENVPLFKDIYACMYSAREEAAEGPWEPDVIRVAYNSMVFSENGGVKKSKIVILGSPYYIQSALLHEIGHYVHYEISYQGTYTLSHFAEDAKGYTDKECLGYEYYIDPREYFAEIFAYTVRQGITAEYEDTIEMAEIINGFQPGKKDPAKKEKEASGSP